jgi:hypothetical protein
MKDPLSILLFFALAMVIAFAVSWVYSRFFSKPNLKPSLKTAPPWIGGQNLEAGREYCHLRADYNYGQKHAGAHVSATYFGLDEQRSEMIADDMMEGKFNQLRGKMRREGWQEAYSRTDQEGWSYYFSRAKR